MVAVQVTVLKTLDGASTPFISHQQMVSVLASAAEEESRREAEREHLHALGAAMFFFRQHNGPWLGSYRDASPEAWASSPDQLPSDVHAIWAVYADTAAHPAVCARLHHLLWTARYGARPFTSLQTAITKYREAASVLLADISPHAQSSRQRAAYALRTAHELAANCNQRQELAEIITEMLTLAGVALAWSEPDYGVITTMTEPLMGDKNNHPQLRLLLQRVVKHSPDGSLHQAEFLKDLRRTEPEPDAQRGIDECIITALISHAERQEWL